MNKATFFSNKNTFTSTKKRWVSSVLIGLVAAVSVYIYLCFIRLFFRLFDNYYLLEATIIEGTERFSQNWHFAIISLVIGNSFFLAWLFRRPNKLNLGLRQHTIISQQFMLSISFFHWFMQLVTLIGLFTGLMSLYDLKIKPLLLLIAVVLFLEGFKGVLRVYRRRAYLAILLNLAVLLALSPIVAAVNVFDYKTLDSISLKKNPIIDVPVVNYAESVKSYRNKYVKMKLENNVPVYFLNESRYNLDQLRDFFIREYKNSSYRYEQNIILLADANISYVDIIDFNNLLDRVNFFNLTFVTKQHKQQRLLKHEIHGVLTSVFPIEKAISISDKKRLPPLPPSPFEKSASFYDTKVKVELKVGGAIMLDSKLVNEKELLDYFLKTIDAVHYFEYQYDNNTSLQNYLTVLSIHKRALKILRDGSKLVEPIYGDYDRVKNKVAYDEDQLRLIKLYPTAIKYQFID